MVCVVLFLRLCSSRCDAQGERRILPATRLGSGRDARRETLLPPLKKGDRGGFDSSWPSRANPPWSPFVKGAKFCWPFDSAAGAATLRANGT
jgi:hypothetical protein